MRRATQYDEKFYGEVVNSGAQRSAGHIVPALIDECMPFGKRVVDVGCGEGVWAAEFERNGCTVVGVDGDYVDRGRLLIESFLPQDLARKGSLKGFNADLAVCLEVAEHLPEQRADSFIQELCGVAQSVIFSAAVPGQGGVGHVNEQWPEYWVGKFRENGFICSGALRFMFWDGAVSGEIENWYAQNMLWCVNEDFYEFHRQEFGNWFEGLAAMPLPLVHPVLFTHIRSLLR